MTDDLSKLTPLALERYAQHAAEARLAYCGELLYAEENDEPSPQPGEFQEPAGPFCGCDTCVVREVLESAWPFMVELARRELAETS